MPDNEKTPLNEPDTDSLRLELGAETVELRHLVSAASTFAALVQEVSRAMTKDARAVVWTVALEPGSVVLPVKPHAEADLRAKLLEAIPSGMAMIEERPERPPYFTDQALQQAQHLANLASDELPIQLENGTGTPVKITKQLVANVDVVTREAQPRIGTIEGRLEEANVRGQKSFQVKEGLTGRLFHCRGGEDITEDDLGAALGKRVSVRGRIREAKAGHHVVEVKQLRVFAAEEDLPTPEDVRGILKPAS